ncbi:hypothetical protein HDU84_004798 [Entophlyctis sp. JEL0112]|nr:hypothetical protein HDU84_004798 [Entophlyctis sp. JEL0112]
MAPHPHQHPHPLSYTPELLLDARLTALLAFSADVKDLAKERADLERDFSRKLDALARKYSTKCAKRFLASKTDEISGTPHSTVEDAWDCIVKSIELRSRAHWICADSLSSDIGEYLKSVSAKHDESRKKHMAFAQRLVAERDVVYADKEKAKKKYDDACESVEAIRCRLDRASDEKSKEKLKLLWHQEILDMNNKKNLYLLAINGANTVKNRYFAEEVPSNLSDLHCLSESIFLSIKAAWQKYSKIEKDFTDRIGSFADSSLIPTIAKISPENDTELFIQLNPQTAPSSYQKLTPKDFIYIPSVMWKETTEMVVDPYARCFMINKLAKLRRKLEQIDKDLNTKLNGIDGLQRLHEGYVSMPNTGDANDVFEV